ncbi:MAG: hypothetical protein ACFFBP_16285, partial [Promethearchaeota archaeon]
CATTEMFGYKRLQMLSPEELIQHMNLYHEHFPDVHQIFVIEEDHFRHPEYVAKTKQYYESNPKVVENVDWFSFGSVDHIWNFADKYGWDAIAEVGIGCIFIGVESKFAGDHGYSKVKEADAREVFNNLHDRGIRTIGAWIAGFDFHDHSNIMEDLNYFVACYPTYEQLTRLSPFPGTALYTKMKKAGRVKNVPWEDVHFWSGSQENIALETHETLNITEYGYDLIYKTWGPSILRKLDVSLRGYEHCLNSDNPIMSEHKSKFFKKDAATLWCTLASMDHLAPNGVVRRRVRKIDEKYRELIGEPLVTQKVFSKILEKRALKFKKENMFDEFRQFPKEEPAKKYIYPKNDKLKDGDIPYITKVISKTPRSLKKSKRKAFIDSNLLKILARFTGDRKKDPYITNSMIHGLRRRTESMAF